MLFIALWAMFSVSQAFAACCGPHGSQWHDMAGPSAMAHAIDARTYDGQEAADGQPCDTPDTPSCPAAFDEVLPLVSSAVVVADGDNLARVTAPPPRSVVMEPAASRWAGQDGDYLSLAPPDPIYLRLKRFLI